MNSNGINLPDFSDWVEVPKGMYVPDATPVVEVFRNGTVTYHAKGLYEALAGPYSKFFIEKIEPCKIVLRYQAMLEVVVDRTTGEISSHCIVSDEGLVLRASFELEDESAVTMSADERDRFEELTLQHLELFPAPLSDF